MISTDDLEYPREYRTLGNSARRFSNVGLVHTSEHRHTVSAAQSLEALTNLHKADMERKRDAFMDHLKSKYQQQQQQLQHPHHSPHHTPPSPSPSHASMRGTSERSAREQVQVPNVMLYCSKVNLLIHTLNMSDVFITLLQFGDVFATSFGAQYVFFGQSMWSISHCHLVSMVTERSITYTRNSLGGVD